MFYAKYIDFSGNERSALYDDFSAYLTDTFNARDILTVQTLSITGKSKEEKREKALQAAKTIKAADASASSVLPFSDYIRLANAFYRLGKKYDLLPDFAFLGVL